MEYSAYIQYIGWILMAFWLFLSSADEAYCEWKGIVLSKKRKMFWKGMFLLSVIIILGGHFLITEV
ncbi:MAG: hypothetical protein CR972_02435 [Candidatus Moraniibacteriota bacterium]|nr:MAG: hypothetical protein CR972_02435 [Candidatus Moranbacteria bacterium]